MFAHLRSCYSFDARLWAGGPTIPLAWYWAPEGAVRYPHAHQFNALNELLQADNTVTDLNNVGEVTPAWYRGTGFRKARSLKRRTIKRPYAFDVGDTPDVDGTEVHGTQAAFLCEDEGDGNYYARIWEPPSTITLEEWNALPECIRHNHESPFYVIARSYGGSRGELSLEGVVILSSRSGSRGELGAVDVDGLVSRCGSRGELGDVDVDALVSFSGSRGELGDVDVDALVSFSGSRGELEVITSVGGDTGYEGGAIVPTFESVGGDIGYEGGADLVDVLVLGGDTGYEGGNNLVDVVDVGGDTGYEGGSGVIVDVGGDTGYEGGVIVRPPPAAGFEGGVQTFVPVELGGDTGYEGGAEES